MRRGGSLTRQFEEAGFTFIRQTNHQIWRCPCGHAQIATHCSPCEGRGYANALALISRVRRVCAQNMKQEGRAA